MMEKCKNNIGLSFFSKERRKLPLTEGVVKKVLSQIIKIFIVFSLLAVFNSFLQVLIISQNQDIKQLQSEIQILNKDISRIKVEMASLESFERIQSIALNELGMKAADIYDYHWIEAFPAVKVTAPKADLQVTVRTGLWGKVNQWVEELGKTMAQTL